MTRSKINLIIDGLMLLCVTAIAGIGLLIKYVLVPGHARWAIYGRNVELFFWGLDRHQWGTVHLTIGLVLITLLVLHIVLHWAMILAIYRSLIPNPLIRRIIVIVLICLTALLLAFPCLVKPQVRELGRGREQGRRGYGRRVSPTQSRQAPAPQATAVRVCWIVQTRKSKSEPNWEVQKWIGEDS